MHLGHVDIHILTAFPYKRYLGSFCLTVPSVTISQIFCIFRVGKYGRGWSSPLLVGISVPESVESIELPVGLSLSSLDLAWYGVFLFLKWILNFLSALSHGQYFSVLLCRSSIKVFLPHLVLTFNSTSTTSLDRWHTNNPSLKSQVAFNSLLILKKKCWISKCFRRNNRKKGYQYIKCSNPDWFPS